MVWPLRWIEWHEIGTKISSSQPHTIKCLTQIVHPVEFLFVLLHTICIVFFLLFFPSWFYFALMYVCFIVVSQIAPPDMYLVFPHSFNLDQKRIATFLHRSKSILPAVSADRQARHACVTLTTIAVVVRRPQHRYSGNTIIKLRKPSPLQGSLHKADIWVVTERK